MSRRITIAVLAGALLPVLPLTAAEAGSQTLCEGYAKCRRAGYSDAEYQANSARSYWRMFVGKNCTNYVAYRLTLDGLVNQRPMADPGRSNASLDAFAWGRTYASRTTNSPKVGAVAWWDADRTSSRLGHVAYVEQVAADGSVVISEDSWSGDPFAWRHLTPDHDEWPDGFIHFAPTQTAAHPPEEDDQRWADWY